MREVRSGSFRVFYTVLEERVVIVAVVHGARDLPNLNL
jgi:plasmid stabilization system protein ParE